MDTLLERWAKDEPEFKIVLAFEVLPSPSGHLHIVDPDPDAKFENYPVSLCGSMLVAKDGKADDSEVCSTCLEISRERQAEFDSRVEDEL